MQKIEPIFVFEFEDDVNRIVGICYEHGYEVSTKDACRIWKDYSESCNAAWMYPPETDQYVLDIVLDWSQPARG